MERCRVCADICVGVALCTIVVCLCYMKHTNDSLRREIESLEKLNDSLFQYKEYVDMNCEPIIVNKELNND